MRACVCNNWFNWDHSLFFDSLAWLWELVDVLMPELYISKGESGMFIRGTLTEAERIVAAARAAGNKKLTIVPYTWIRYYDVNTGSSAILNHIYIAKHIM